ncbi:MAG: hypothetical protein R2911_34825 [Caldilineaceae bacterium]
MPILKLARAPMRANGMNYKGVFTRAPAQDGGPFSARALDAI